MFSSVADDDGEIIWNSKGCLTNMMWCDGFKKKFWSLWRIEKKMLFQGVKMGDFSRNFFKKYVDFDESFLAHNLGGSTYIGKFT